ncbi:MAG: Hsp20 family protein [Desulfurococcales archaeon]|nr:Hsp20 family protein [Desulfurococcales archaeon]
MAYYDPFAVFDETLKRILRRMEELRAQMLAEYEEMERMFEDRIRQLERGETEPLVSIYDEGDKYIIVVDVPGARGSTVEVKFSGNKMLVEAVIDEKFAEEALSDTLWAGSVRRFRGEYVLPEPVDVQKIRLRRFGSRVLIEAPKLR